MAKQYNRFLDPRRGDSMFRTDVKNFQKYKCKAQDDYNEKRRKERLELIREIDRRDI